MDRTFLYRRGDPLALVQAAELTPTAQAPGPRPASHGSLLADLANSRARNARFVSRAQPLERRLSEALGEKVRRQSGLGAAPDVEELQRTITGLEQQALDLNASSEDARSNWRLPGKPTGS